MSEGEAGERVCAWHASVLTLFPDMFPGPLGFSLLGQALKNGLWTLDTLDFRTFASDKHRSVDAPPAGGGPGLVMRADIAAAAIDAARARSLAERPVIYLSPRGAPFTQARARELAEGPGAILLCGRFEGIDERALFARDVEEICVGDAVLTGGEIPAMAVLDASLRLIPGVLGASESLEEESFSAGLLEHPQYTKPAIWEGHEIPPVLLSGHHGKVAEWRLDRSKAITQERRPDLWKAYQKRHAPAEQSDAKNTGAQSPNNKD
ncbi:MAG: tRNA (guanosine(37)-N1)-methyltransferase TrmD [Neomegalonema sp.]|nr:tRNA (guanosine(37)-N1)-methyltransferase TrmD [Neomegalonema sp.]